MKISFFRSDDRNKRHETAAKWVMKSDAGLSPAQQDALHEWFGEDPRNREAFIAFSGVWGEFDRLAGLHETIPCHFGQDILKPPHQSRKWGGRFFTLCGVGLAASLLFILFIWMKPDLGGRETISRSEYVKRIEQLTFEDGSTCELRRGSEVEVAFSAHERRVRLVRGEAVFSVQKDPARPFRVEVGEFQVEAVGTVFNVRDSSHQVDVIVTEGRVKLSADPDRARDETVPSENVEVALIGTLEKASVPKLRGVASAVIVPLDRATVEEALIWRPKRLEFIDTPLAVVVSEFNRRNEIQIVLGSEDLSGLSITSFFWSDDVEAFVRLLERGFNTRVIWSDENKIIITHPA